MTALKLLHNNENQSINQSINGIYLFLVDGDVGRKVINLDEKVIGRLFSPITTSSLVKSSYIT